MKTVKVVSSVACIVALVATYVGPFGASAASSTISFCHAPSGNLDKAKKFMNQPLNSWSPNGHVDHDGDFIINNQADENLCDAIVAGTQCADQIDNDNDNLIDNLDPACHSDHNANNPSSYDPSLDDESDDPIINQPPTIDSISPISGNELSNIPFDANANDPEGDTLTYSLSGAPEGSSIDSLTGVFTWYPTEVQGPGVYNFNVCVTDGLNSPVCTPVQITVNEVNQSPTVINHSYSTHMNMNLLFTLVGSDLDFPIQTLSFSVVDNVTNGVIQSLGSNSYQYVPGFNFVGGDLFTYKANDGLADSNVGTVTIVVNNNAPLIDPIADVTVPELSLLTVNPSSSDPNGDVITYSIGGTPPSGLAIDSSTGQITWTPNESQGPGSYPITVEITDGSATNSTSFNILVTEVNEAPVAQDSSSTTQENTPVLITLVANDTDLPAQTLIFTIDTQPTNGTLGVLSGNQVEYKPNVGFTGADTFKFLANDGLDNSNIAEVSIMVTDLPACSDGIDNDQDNLIDSEDPGCSSSSDNDETDPPIPPTAPPTPQGNNDDADTTNSSNGGGHRRDISGISSGGEVLGAFDELLCAPYLNEYIGLHKKNNPEEVKKLEIFLNEYMGANVPVDGTYDSTDFSWVERFQSIYDLTVLKPWADAGLPTNGPTGYVYKTTKRWINILKCPDMIMNTPVPPLP